MRLLGKWIITLFVLAIATLTILMAFIQSPYGSNVLQSWAKWRYDLNLTIQKVDYQFAHPWRLTLYGLNLPNHHTTAQTLTLQLTPWHFPYNYWALDSLTLNGLVQKESASLPRLPSLTVKNIRLKNWQWQNEESQLPNNQLTLIHWHNLPYRPQNPQFTLVSVGGTWQQKTFKEMRITGTRQSLSWQFDLNLSWDKNRLYATGKWQPDTHHLALKRLRLAPLYIASSHEQATLTDYLQTQLSKHTIQKIDIHRLMLQEGHFSTNNIQADNLTLDVQNWQWPKTHWQQNKAHLQLTADHLIWKNTPLQNVTLQSVFTPQNWQITQAQSQVFDGFLTIKGKMTPTNWHIHDFNINGARFTNEQIVPQISLPEKITIDQLKWQQGQYLDTKRQFALDTFNLTVKNMEWQRHQQWAPASGVVDLSVSKGQWLGKDFRAVLLQAEKTDQYWQLKQFLLPIQEGLLSAQGHINTEEPDWPWQFRWDAKNLPTTLLTEGFNWPIKMTGNWDITGNLSGSGESVSALKHSITGTVYGEGRDLRLYSPKDQSLLSYWSKWKKHQGSNFKDIAQESVSITPWQLELDRGIMQVSPILFTSEHITAQLKGQWGLVQKEATQITLDAQANCQQLHRIWPDPQGLSTLSGCDIGKSKYVP